MAPAKSSAMERTVMLGIRLCSGSGMESVTIISLIGELLRCSTAGPEKMPGDAAVDIASAAFVDDAHGLRERTRGINSSSTIRACLPSTLPMTFLASVMPLLPRRRFSTMASGASRRSASLRAFLAKPSSAETIVKSPSSSA